MKKITTFISLLGCLLCLSHLSATVALAADNNEEGGICEIQISGQKLSLTSADAPDIRAGSTNGKVDSNKNKIYTYSISACGDLSLHDGETPVRAALGFNADWWGFSNFGVTTIKEVLLERDGNCYSASFEFATFKSFGVVDIEQTNGKPICYRGYGKFKPATIEQANTWDTAIQSTCNSFERDPVQPIRDNNVFIKYTFHPALASTIVTDPDGETWFLNYKLVNTITNKIETETRVDFVEGLNTRSFALAKAPASRFRSVLYLSSTGKSDQILCRNEWSVGTPENPGGDQEVSGDLLVFDVCKQIPENGPDGNPSDLIEKCRRCLNTEGIWTAVGCIKTDAKSIVREVVQIGLGLAGGIALLMIVAAGFLLSTSQNDPKKVTEAKDLITSAIIGLLFIVFSVTILQFIGVTILRIPGFGV